MPIHPTKMSRHTTSRLQIIRFGSFETNRPIMVAMATICTTGIVFMNPKQSKCGFMYPSHDINRTPQNGRRITNGKRPKTTNARAMSRMECRLTLPRLHMADHIPVLPGMLCRYIFYLLDRDLCA